MAGQLEPPSRELPDVRGPRVPVGYRRGLELGERLAGLGVVLLGIGSLALAFWLPGAVPARFADALACTPLLVGLAGAGLIALGLRRALDP